ncbi:MAG TPA: hypothetical protein VGM90_30970 [Kofleriaceae bacterium]
MKPVLWTSAALQQTLLKRLQGTFEAKTVRALSSIDEIEQLTKESVLFVDEAGLTQIAAAGLAPQCPTIGIATEDPRRTTVAWLREYPWLTHVIGSGILELELSGEHIANVMRTLRVPQPRLLDWIDSSVKGRRIKLSKSSMRVERLEKMSDYLQSGGVGERTIENLRDVAEELLTNAFYDAPVAAGAFKGAISRTQEVVLPEDRACDLAYGCSPDLAMVRVRDPFGSLSHRRIVEVLTRCASNQMDVIVDESMGGAGLGLWRVVSVASFIGISVIKEQQTEILVGIATKRSAAARPFALHLFFKDPQKRGFWRFVDEDSTRNASLNKSVTILAK